MSDAVDVQATVLSPTHVDDPVEARLGLGETLSVTADDFGLAVDLASVFDVRVGTPPQAAADAFGGDILTVGFDGEDGREVLFADTDDRTLETVAGLLYRQLLHGVEVAVCHPAKVGGRVSSKSFEIGELQVAPGKVGCVGIDKAFALDLARIVDFSRSTQTLLNEERPVIDIEYVTKGVTVSLALSLTPTRKHHLLGRFLRRDYEDVKADLQSIDLPTPAFQALVRLYSLRGTAKPQSLVRDSSVSTAKLIRGLVRADLVEVQDGQVALTPRGWILVTEHVGDGQVDPDQGLQGA
ncbi:CheF family chemotaxis protein [Halobacteriales archaeon Cl-PHB]